MNVSRLLLRDFRSYPHEELLLSRGLVAVVGPNGSGKTNILEAIHLAVQGFSLRTRRDAAVVRFGSPAARVEAEGRRGGGVPFAVTATVDSGGVKRIVLDGAAIERTDELRRVLAALAFTPDRLAVAKGGPLVRRTYLDRMLGRLLPAHAELPGEYARALAQRNTALRRVQVGTSSLDALAPWDETLVLLGQALDAVRAKALAALGPEFEETTEALGLVDAHLSYDARPLDEKALLARRSRDLERGTTGLGPHLADVAFTAGSRDLRAYGSQGEQRLVVLALLLAEARLLTASREDPPMLLLDDVLSELDDERRRALLACVPPGSQTIVTATTLRALPPEGPGPDQVVDVVSGRATSR